MWPQPLTFSFCIATASFLTPLSDNGWPTFHNLNVLLIHNPIPNAVAASTFFRGAVFRGPSVGVTVCITGPLASRERRRRGFRATVAKQLPFALSLCLG